MANCDETVAIANKLYGYDLNPESVSGTISWSRMDNVEAILQTEEYVKERPPRYLNRFSNYMLQRVAWTTAKNFAMSGRRDWFRRFGKNYSVSKYMRRLVFSFRER